MRPSIRAFVVSLLAIASCQSSPRLAPEARPTDWVLVAIDGSPTIEGHSPSLSLRNHGSVVAFASCNQHGGRMTRWGDRVTISSLDSTDVRCEIAGIDMQRHASEAAAFLAVLTSGPLQESASTAGELVLRAADGRELRFRPSQ